MIDRKATPLDFELSAQPHSTTVFSQTINIPGLISDPQVRSGIAVTEFIKDTGVINRVAFGVFVAAIVGDAALDFRIQMATPIGTFIDLFDLSTISAPGVTNILFDPSDQTGTNGFDLVEKNPISFDTIRVQCQETGSGIAEAFYTSWMTAS